jgi:dolichol-phosphate mannosyltransferase subunit 3
LCPSYVNPGTRSYKVFYLTFLQLPFWGLVSFGAVLLFRLGFGILTFNDVPDAHKELMAEIDMAKADLRKLGVDVD